MAGECLLLGICVEHREEQQWTSELMVCLLKFGLCDSEDCSLWKGKFSCSQKSDLLSSSCPQLSE